MLDNESLILKALVYLHIHPLLSYCYRGIYNGVRVVSWATLTLIILATNTCTICRVMSNIPLKYKRNLRLPFFKFYFFISFLAYHLYLSTKQSRVMPTAKSRKPSHPKSPMLLTMVITIRYQCLKVLIGASRPQRYFTTYCRSSL